MPDFEITAPDGTKYSVTGPDGSTEQQALAQVQAAHGATPPSTMQDLKNVAPDLPWYGLSAGAGMFGDLANLVGLGGKKYSPPTTADLRAQLEGPNKEFPLYQPQTAGGRIAQGVAEGLPTAPLLPGGIALKAAQTIIPPIVSEATGSPLLGAAAGIGTGVAGAGRQGARTVSALEQAQRVTPQELIGEGGRLRDVARQSQIAIDPRQALNLVAQTRNELANAGQARSLATGAHATIDELEASAQRALQAGQPLSANDVLAYRQTLTGHTKGIPTTSTNAAGRAKGVFDDWLRQNAPTLASVADEANANFRPGYLAQDIANKSNRATYGASATNSGMNIENRLRSSLVGIVSDPNKLRQYAPEVQRMMVSAVNGTITANGMRTLGNLLGGGGGIGAVATGFLGHSAAGLPGAFAPALGYGIKRIGNQLTLNKLDAIGQTAMANSPLAQTRRAMTQPQIDAARESIRSSKLSAARKATMLQALDRVAGQSTGAVGRADENQ